MPLLGLQLVQAAAGYVMNILGHAEQQEDTSLDEWQLHFRKQLYKVFKRAWRIPNYKVQADFFKALMPVEQKNRRVPITFQEKVDKEIGKIRSQGHIEKLEECSDKYFVSPIVITVKKTVR